MQNLEFRRGPRVTVRRPTVEDLEERLTLSGVAYPVATIDVVQSPHTPPLASANGELFVAAGSGLLRSDGGSYSNLGAAPVQSVFDWNGTLLFQGGASPRDALYKLDPGGRAPVELTAAGQTRISGATRFFPAAPDKLFVGAAGNIYLTDGTPAGTRLVTAGGPLAVSGGRLFFNGPGAATGTSALWVTDGTPAGTAMVRDNFGAYSAVDLDGVVVLGASDGIYRSDGTAAGTYRISTVGGGLPLVRAASAAYFVNAVTGGVTLYKTDGTAAGTVAVRDKLLLADSIPPLNQPTMTAVGDTLYFAAYDAAGCVQVYSTTGPGTTQQVTEFPSSPPNYSGVFQGLAQVDGRLFFPVRAGPAGFELWTSDGTPGNSQRVTGLAAEGGAIENAPLNLTAVGGSLFFTRLNAAGTIQLWRYGVDPVILDADGTLVVNGTDPAEGGTGRDTITLARAGADVLVTVNGTDYTFDASAVRRITVDALGGDDALTISPTLSLASDGRVLPVTYNAGPGSESLAVGGSGGADAIAIGPGGVTLTTAAGTWSLSVRDLDALSVNAGGGNDQITVSGNPAGSLTVDGAGGDDTLTVGGAGLLEAVTGPVTLTGGSGSNALTFDDSANAASGTAAANDPAGLTGDRFALAADALVRTRAANKGTQSFTYSQFAGGITLRAGTAANLISVRPDPLTPITVDGGDPQAVSPTLAGDALVIDLAGAESPARSATGPGAGTYTFADRATVRYAGIEVPDNLASPTPPKATFLYYATPQKLAFRFAEPVLPGPLAAGLSLVNLTTGQTIPASVLPLAYATLSNAATFTFTGASRGVLPAGHYRATLPAASVQDLSGASPAADVVFEFTVRPGDANGDGRVDGNDLLILANNYNAVGVGYTGGDFTYDGRVNFDDLLVLAKNYQGGPSAAGTPTTDLPAPVAAIVDALAAGSPPSPGVGLDTTFGTAGHVITSFGSASADFAAGATRTPDGKLVAVGGAGGDLAVLRYNADGSLDPAFGSGGVVRYHLDNSTQAVAVHALPDGRLLVAGWAIRFVNSTQSRTLVLMRLNADGTFDPTFGTGGVTTVGNGTADSMVVLSDGRILVGGHIGTDGSSAFAALWRFNADGSPDTAFGVNGRLTQDQKVYTQSLTAAAALPDGRALVRTNAGLARLNADGTFDSTFGTNGLIEAGSPTVQPDGKILSVWAVAPDTDHRDVIVRRYTPDGLPDATFGTNGSGSAPIDLGGLESAAPAVLQEDGKILLGIQYTSLSARNSADFALVRLLPDGTIDPGFGVGGHLIDPFNTPDTSEELLQGVVLLSPGRVVAFGGTNLLPPGDQGTEFGNIALAAYALDPAIDLRTGGPYGPVNEAAPFTASAAGTTYAGGTIVKYEWDYGYDGVSFVADAQGATAQLVAGDSGTVTLALRVTTSDGIQAIATTTVDVRNVAPTVDAGPVGLTVPGTPVTLRPTADDVVPESFTFTIDWGDGSAPTTTAPTAPATHASVALSHTYAARGVYTVTVTASDGDGGVATDTTTVRVGDVLATVFLDANGNGSQTVGELPQPGQRVFLDLNLNGVFDAGEPAGLTDDAGQYLFEGLAPDVYSVRAVPLNSYQFSAPAGGAVDATVWAGGGALATFGLTRRATIWGSVFDDANGNGRWDLGETPVTGRAVTVTPVNGTPGSTVSLTSDALGNFRTAGLVAGTYVVRATPPGGWVQTTPGAAAGRLVTVGASEVAGGVDFGQVQASPGSVTGSVFADVDGDGIRGTGEKGAAGQRVFVDANNDGAFDANELAATTDSSGNYTLAGLPAGTYTVRLVPRGGWVPTATAGGQQVTVTPGGQTAAQPFGTQQVDFVPPHVTASTFDPATGRVQLWFDEPITGLTSSDLFVTGSGRTNPYALVGYDPVAGLATFDQQTGAPLPPGNYRVQLPAGSVSDLAGNPLATTYTANYTSPAPAPAFTSAVTAPASGAPRAGRKKAPTTGLFSVVKVAAPAPPRAATRPRTAARHAAR